jgi:hypothetical protein
VRVELYFEPAFGEKTTFFGQHALNAGFIAYTDRFAVEK